jgi:hypothetical protein
MRFLCDGYAVACYTVCITSAQAGCLTEERFVPKRRYLAFLLRLWDEGGDPPRWRATLETPQDGERRAFAGLADLFAFLVDETGSGWLGCGRPGDEREGLSGSDVGPVA